MSEREREGRGGEGRGEGRGGGRGEGRGGGGGCLVGYCIMIEITQMALSYYQNKLLKDCFLKHHGRNDPERERCTSSRHHLQDS